MCIWHLYVSGIRCADLRFTPCGVLHAPLDPETAVLAPFQPLSAEAAAGYLALTHFDLEALAGRMAEYERLFPGPPEVETSWGARYRSDDGVRWAQREIKYPWNVTVSGGRLAAFTCPSRERVHVLVREGCEDATVLARWRAYRPEPILPVRRVENLEVPMRDGVALSTSLLLPRTDRPVPAVLVRTPYGKEGHGFPTTLRPRTATTPSTGSPPRIGATAAWAWWAAPTWAMSSGRPPRPGIPT